MNSAAKQKTSPPNIIIIDDEEKICELMKAFLEQTGLFGKIITATSPSIGLLKIQNDQFDLAIVDYKMPLKDGIELIDIFKTTPYAKKMKIILISGYLNTSVINAAVGLGVRQILVKPFTRSALVDKVIKLLQ